MDRGKIKIIEFGKDEERAGGAATDSHGAGRMKIVEFDDERPRPKGERAPPPPWGPSASRARIGAIKIKEFDDEGNERPRAGGGAGAARIKIVEFD